jgi:toxin ParE1/3/4
VTCRQLLISERAEADLREIWRWTYDRFGPLQADRYLDELEGEMRECVTRPESGKNRDAFRAGYRTRLVRKHVIFYTATDVQVLIQRILHGSMDFEIHLPSDQVC